MAGTGCNAAIDIHALRQWIGRRKSHRDSVTAAPIAAMAATLDRDETPPCLPPPYHWLYFDDAVYMDATASLA